jgi:hypothetical protein
MIPNPFNVSCRYGGPNIHPEVHTADQRRGETFERS